MTNFIPSDLNLSLHNNHPLIERKNNYLLDRKLLTVHSEDRDYSKWKFANEFEIQCPQSYTNIQSMRLTEINFPCNYYNFSEALQNTKFSVYIPVFPSFPSYSGVPTQKVYIIDISDGYYTNTQLAATLTYRLNTVIDISSIYQSSPTWQVVYHEVKQKMLIGNNGGIVFYLSSLILDNSGNPEKEFSYNIPCGSYNLNSSVNYYQRYNKWGLLAYIGFNKGKTGKPIFSNESLVLEYENPVNIWLNDTSANIYYLESPKIIDILGEMVIYMEIDYFNSYDELIPWPDTSGNTHCFPQGKNVSAYDVKNCPRNTNPKWPGKQNYPTPPPGPAEPKYVAHRGSGINSAFAKIPLIDIPKTQIFSSANGFLFNLSHYNPPVERISKFKFRFRYHDGRLVDFQDNDLNFTLEINQLRNEINKDMNIRMPYLYNLS